MQLIVTGVTNVCYRQKTAASGFVEEFDIIVYIAVALALRRSEQDTIRISSK